MGGKVYGENLGFDGPAKREITTNVIKAIAVDRHCFGNSIFQYAAINDLILAGAQPNRGKHAAKILPVKNIVIKVH